ncbi:hypothetical protein LXA43DRAFT_1060282 [Ganoderma leucocontextum]|nr:hypothetical protein LXA43DRAFT_1060282 [Ganoderma leucocontextum]
MKRPVLRRDGCYEEYDLNTQLTIPFVSHISQNWCKLFQSNLFGVFETATVQAVEELVDQVVRSVPEYLTSRARKQGEVALEQTRAFLVESVSVVQRALDAQQRTISRKLAPHVQEQLKEGYQNALLITGPGTTSDQKIKIGLTFTTNPQEAVHDYIDEKKDEVFCGAAEVLMGDLDDAAKAIGEALEVDLTRLSMTVENTIAILWEGPLEDDKGVKTRVELMRLLDKAIAQADDWLTK